MTNATHTPGPWIAKARGYLSHVGTTGDEPFSVEVCGNNHRENARLIAAAPDLLAALKLAADTFADHDEDCQLNGYLNCNCTYGPAHVHMRAAIAKAKGE